MSSFAKSFGPRITRQVLKLRDRTLLEGAMATGALVAMADRRVLLEESLALGSALKNMELLQIHDPELALSLYGTYVERIRADFDAGKRYTLEIISRCTDDLEAAELLLKVGIAIAKADKEFSKEELEVVEEICLSLGILGFDPALLAGPASERRPH